MNENLIFLLSQTSKRTVESINTTFKNIKTEETQNYKKPTFSVLRMSNLDSIEEVCAKFSIFLGRPKP